MPQWQSSQASPPPSTALRGPIGSSTEGPKGKVRMRLPRPGQRFVACRELHRRRPQLRHFARPIS
eukprot:2116386-Pyramimonas_sp.AAC.1